MKKVVLSILSLIIIGLPVMADNMPPAKLKPLKNKAKISYNQANGIWAEKPDCKHELCFLKVKGFGDFSDYLFLNSDFAFTTDCEHEFIVNGKLIGHSNKNLNFYEIDYVNGKVQKTLLDKEEVQALFPEYRVVCLSEFSENTNALKIKKGFGDLKILLLNDKGILPDVYKFSSGNAKFEQYDMSGFIKITKSGMIQFSDYSDNSSKNLWYVLLIR